MTNRHRRPAGFTLTELAIVLGVIGLILGGIWTTAATVSKSNKDNQAVRQITIIAANVRGLYGTRGSFSAQNTTNIDITAALISANIFPPETLGVFQTGQLGGRVSQNHPTNAWGGPIAVYAIDSNTFRVSYYGVKGSDCLTIASQIIGNSGSNTAATPIRLITDSGQTPVLDLTQPYTSADISGRCNVADTDTSGQLPISVEFDYSLQ